MKAIGIAEPSDLKALTAYAGGVDRILLDAKPPRTANALPGGNGLAFDWRLLAGLDPKLSFMLSGGLDSRQRGGGDPADPAAGRRCVVRGGKRTGSQGSGADRGLHQGRPDSFRRCPSLTSGCVPLPGRASSFKAGQAVSAQAQPNSFRTGPDERGHFGIFGGRFVAETLMPLILELEKAYDGRQGRSGLPCRDGEHDSTHYIGRPSPLYFAERLTEHLGGAKIYFKREELNHTGAHKVNNVLGQILLARRMGKKRIIAETGAGQHGVATATLCARFGLDCVVYMGAVDVERQKPNVFRMNMLGAKVVPVQSGTRTLKDAMNEALRDWVTNVADTFYCIGTVAGPHPYPAMVRDFQCVIGNETREQMMEAEGRLPDSLVACIGGGSNAIGLFHPFLDDAGRRDLRRRGGRPRPRQAACGLALRRPSGRAARQPHLSAHGR